MKVFRMNVASAMTLSSTLSGMRPVIHPVAFGLGESVVRIVHSVETESLILERIAMTVIHSSLIHAATIALSSSVRHLTQTYWERAARKDATVSSVNVLGATALGMDRTRRAKVLAHLVMNARLMRPAVVPDHSRMDNVCPKRCVKA